MDMLKIERYLPDTAKNVKHKAAVAMRELVSGMAEANEGKVLRFEVSAPGTALILVMGEQATQTVMREFRKLQDVAVSLVPALEVSLAQNKTLQKRADKARERWDKTRQKNAQ